MACRSFDPGLASTSKVDFLRAALVAANLDLLVPGSLLHTVRKTEPLLRLGLYLLRRHAGENPDRTQMIFTKAIYSSNV